MGKTLGIPGYENVVAHKSNIDMTNELKAMEIAECCSVMPPTSITQADVIAMTNNAAMQAMEWKDEQHKQEKQQLIDKACEWLKDNEYGFETADEAIIAFKKSMKGE